MASGGGQRAGGEGRRDGCCGGVGRAGGGLPSFGELLASRLRCKVEDLVSLKSVTLGNIYRVF